MKDTILIVDDMEVNRTILAELFWNDHIILEAHNGKEALDILDGQQVSLMLLDVEMPIMDGFEVLQELERRGRLAGMPVMILVPDDMPSAEVRAFDLGAADILRSPLEPHIVKRRVRNLIELYRHKNNLEQLVAEQARSLQASNEAMIDALSSVIEYRSIESGQHIRRIRMFTKVLLTNVAETYPGYHLDEKTINIIASASAMHDIGKIAIPDSILNKPGRLTRAEFDEMKTHSSKGGEIIRSIPWMDNREYLQYAYTICRYHHERWDGSGYPDGVRGDNIPLCAQVAGIADAYDALTTHRVYKAAYPHEQAMNMMLNGECGAFSPRLLECLKNVRGRFEELAMAYRDGLSPEKDTFSFQLSNKEAVDPEQISTSQYGQLKYFTLLRYLHSTVLELDLDQVVFHVVYKENSDFDSLCRANNMKQAFTIFLEQSVHPEDRELVSACLTGSLQELYECGESGHFWEFRVRSHLTNAYHRYLATVLKVDTETPRQHRALIVFDDVEDAKALQTMHNQEELLYLSALRSTYSAALSIHLGEDSYTLVLGEDSRLHWDGLPERFSGFIQAIAATLVHPEDRAHFLAEMEISQLQSLQQSGSKSYLQYRRLDQEGVYRWVDSMVVAVDHAADEETLLFAFVRDIDEQKRKEEQANLVELRLQSAFRDYFTAVLELDVDQKRFYMLKKIGPQYEIPQEGMMTELSQFIARFVHPDDQQPLLHSTECSLLKNIFLAGAEQLVKEYRAQMRNGSWGWFQAVFTPETRVTAKHCKLLLFVQPLYNKEIQLAAPAGEGASLDTDLSELLRIAPGGVAEIALDAELTLLRGTEGFFALTGYTPTTFFQPPIEGKCLRLLEGMGLEQVASLRDRVAQQGDAQMELKLQTANSASRRINCAIRARADMPHVVLGLFTDVSAAEHLDPASNAQGYFDLLWEFNDVLFEYNLQTGSVHFSDQFLGKFGFSPPRTLAQMIEHSTANIHPSDVECYLKTLSNMRESKGKKLLETEYRYRHTTGHFVWCWERMCVLCDEEGNPVKTVGIISDVGRYKLQNELLQARADTDQLTGLYNKITTENLIRSAIADSTSGNCHALFMIDIDDFKIVNDSSGHLMGDEVLKRIAARISAQFRKNDIVGRIGGDEFMVLLRDVPDPMLIRKKAAAVLEALRDLFADLAQHRSISASVGIAVYPQDGGDFRELFQKADAALYACKRSGKEQWRMYSPNFQPPQQGKPYASRTNRIESVQEEDGFFVQALSMMYEIQDEEEAINALLDVTARYYGLNHIYVCEAEDQLRGLFDWCADAAVRYHGYTFSCENQTHSLTQLLEEMHPQAQPFVSSSLAQERPEIRDLFHELGDGAILQAPILDHGQLFGVAGFSERGHSRAWTDEEIAACRFLARTVSMVYLRKRMQQKMEQITQMNQLLFEFSGRSSYVVDGRFSILEVNNSLQSMVPNCCGRKCYQVLRKRESPCPDCPILHLNKAQVSYEKSLFVDILCSQFAVKAVRVKWYNGKDAFYMILRDTSNASQNDTNHLSKDWFL